MAEFNDATGSNIDSISLAPFKKRFEREIDEQENLKAAAKLVMDMASRVAVAMNITVPASTPTKAKPKLSFTAALKAMRIVEDDSTPSSKKSRGKKSASVEGPTAWLIEPLLKEEAESVQMLALMDQKLTKGGSEAIKAFATKLDIKDQDLTNQILDALEDARKQMAQSESIIAEVTAYYTLKEKQITVILNVRDGVASTNAYVSGK